MITADQLLAHAIGDYWLQSHWMATHKTRESGAALAHALTYAIPFLFFLPSPGALFVIASSHFLIDRFRLARWLVLTKNVLLCPPEWFERNSVYESHTGYPQGTPDWLGVWLLIIADNICHILLNGLALYYL